MIEPRLRHLLGLSGASLLTLAALVPGLQGEPATTPAHLPGSTAYVYRDATPDPVRLHVVHPEGWTATDRRPALVWFFGGGFVRGTPDQSLGWARHAARQGMVGIAADYRVRERWPEADLRDTVADARAALRWVQDHATALGIDPTRVVVGGASAGGHLALWTAISATPPGLDPAEAPLHPPAALLLTNPASDTSRASGLRVERFNLPDPDAFSPRQHLPDRMPPVFLIHGDADTVVPHAHSAALHAALVAGGNTCTWITVPGGTHRFSNEPEWRERLPALHTTFLSEVGLLPVAQPTPAAEPKAD